ncbi:MAG: phage holin family protein [Defluviitaleaceae bacterium]|nr:phage holin family protein [Defluviitaleaceae bacterium]
MRVYIASGAAAIGGCIALALGGWDSILHALIALMAVDYITGMVVAGVFKKSKKSTNGALSSHSAWKGLIKKGVQLLIVYIGVRLDAAIGTVFMRNSVIFAILARELISIMENVGLMGVSWPPMLRKALDILHEKSAGEENQDAQLK